MVVRTDPTYFDVMAFNPLSLMNLFDFAEIGKKWHYPLKAINFFEVIYWIMVIAGVYAKSRKEYRKAVYIVLLGGVIPFFIWLGFYVLVYK